MSGRDLILLIGGLFLLVKATHEIHDRIEGGAAHGPATAAASGKAFGAIVCQIAAIGLIRRRQGLGANANQPKRRTIGFLL